MQDRWVSMAVPSDGSYGIPAGVMYSFPVKIKNGEWEVVQVCLLLPASIASFKVDGWVQGLSTDDFAKEKMKATLTELQQEAADAEAACA